MFCLDIYLKNSMSRCGVSPHCPKESWYYRDCATRYTAYFTRLTAYFSLWITELQVMVSLIWKYAVRCTKYAVYAVAQSLYFWYQIGQYIENSLTLSILKIFLNLQHKCGLTTFKCNYQCKFSYLAILLLSDFLTLRIAVMLALTR